MGVGQPPGPSPAPLIWRRRRVALSIFPPASEDQAVGASYPLSRRTRTSPTPSRADLCPRLPAAGSPYCHCSSRLSPNDVPARIDGYGRPVLLWSPLLGASSRSDNRPCASGLWPVTRRGHWRHSLSASPGSRVAAGVVVGLRRITASCLGSRRRSIVAVATTLSFGGAGGSWRLRAGARPRSYRRHPITMFRMGSFRGFNARFAGRFVYAI